MSTLLRTTPMEFSYTFCALLKAYLTTSSLVDFHSIRLSILSYGPINPVVASWCGKGASRL